MIQKKNRNVVHVYDDDPASGNSSKNVIFRDKLKDNGRYIEFLGEIIRETPEFNVSDEDGPNSEDVKALVLGKSRFTDLSSNSSLSWSNEFEIELTKNIQAKLEELDRVVRGLETSEKYDIEEIEEWRTLFPNLRILGNKHSQTTSTPDTVVDSDSTSDDSKKLAQNESLKMPSELIKNRQREKQKNKHFLKPKSLEIGEFLKVSALRNSQTSRKQSAASLYNAQLRKGQISSEYHRLPYLTARLGDGDARGHTKNKMELQKGLILPPISNQFRSISAVPRNHLTFGSGISESALKNDLMKFLDHIAYSNR